MKKAIKKIASRVRLPSTRRSREESPRNITPPRTTETDKAFTTPPHTTAQESDNPTPGDLVIATPGTPRVEYPATESDSDLPQKRPEQRFPHPAIDRDPTTTDPVSILNPEMVKLGITGADLTLPLFDGTSTDPSDYLINFDDDSMEKHPDVRMYFWSVGQAIEDNYTSMVDDQLMDYQERLRRDDALVKKGREYLRQSKIKGEGYYISPKRDLLAGNHPGRPWFRLPTIEIADKLRRGELEPMDDEGYYASDGDHHVSIGIMVKTNVRVPVLWGDILKTGEVPGTAEWFGSLDAQYLFDHNPCSNWNGQTRTEQIVGIFSIYKELLLSIWPDLFDKKEEEVVEKATPAEIERLKKRMGNVEDFLYGKKEYRKKKFLGFKIR